MRNLIRLIVVLGALILFDTANAKTGRFRAMFGANSSSDITIGFDAYAKDSNPVLYYDTNPINNNNLSIYSSQTPDAENSQYGMETRFVRLRGLVAGQTYYFVVKDKHSISKQYSFEIPSNQSDAKLSIIAGGDSRNNLDVRAVANKIVSKLHAHAFMFDGDFTNDGKANEWQQWLDDWQLSFSSNNRITPLIPARGNHESSNAELINLFDCPTGIYYTNSLGGILLDIYTLNSEMNFTGAASQTAWLKNEMANSKSTWKFVQYHKPIRPHVSAKYEGSIQYAYWANLFYQYGVNMVLEGDAHAVKTTWPIIPCSGGFNCDEGFKRDDVNGAVYLGEGSYAAPLRTIDDDKKWTRDSGSFHQFKWLFIQKDKVEIRTVKYDVNTHTNVINELPINNRFTIPQNLDVWNPSNGDVVRLYKSTSNIPTCTLTVPNDNAMYFNYDDITLTANALGTSVVSEVQFYVDGVLIETDNSTPFEINWQPTNNKHYVISAIAKDVSGLSSVMDFSTIKVGSKNNIKHSASIDISSDEYQEDSEGKINGNMYKVEIAKSKIKLQGLRFKEINIPPNAIIESATIRFFASRAYKDLAEATVWCEKSGNALPFRGEKYNISSRIKTDSFLEWTVDPWDKSTYQTTPDLSSIVQELVQLPDWCIESPIVFLMEGNKGTRRADSYFSINSIGDPATTPTLTVQFSIPNCLNSVCDDGNPITNLDILDSNCNCIGERRGCIDETACNYDLLATVEDNSCYFRNELCDDGNADTIEDTYNENCECIGKPSCPAQQTVYSNTNNNTTLQNVYESSQSIKTEVTTSSNIDVLISTNETVDLKSNHITLNQGFKVETGGCLNAEIKPCE